jgi:hypothetical protein
MSSARAMPKKVISGASGSGVAVDVGVGLAVAVTLAVAVPVGIPVAVCVGVGEFAAGEVGACVAVESGGAVAVAAEVATAVEVGVTLAPASSSPPQPSKTHRPISGKTNPYRDITIPPQRSFTESEVGRQRNTARHKGGEVTDLLHGENRRQSFRRSLLQSSRGWIQALVHTAMPDKEEMRAASFGRIVVPTLSLRGRPL